MDKMFTTRANMNIGFCRESRNLSLKIKNNKRLSLHWSLPCQIVFNVNVNVDTQVLADDYVHGEDLRDEVNKIRNDSIANDSGCIQHTWLIPL